MEIKYPKENKVIKISNKKTQKNTETLQVKNQIDRIKYQIDELETNSQGLKQTNDTNKQQLENIETTLRNHTTQIGQNTNNITTNTNNILANASNISTLQSAVATNTSGISSLDQRLTNTVGALSLQGTHITSIEADVLDLQNGKQDALTAGSGISITTNNNVTTISATGGSGWLSSVTAGDVDSESATSGQVLTADGNGGASWQTASGGGSCNCASDIADIQVEQIVQNNEISHSSVNLGYVKKYLSLMDTPIDPDYNPQTYTQETENTVFQTQAEFNRKYNKQFTKTLTTPKMIFSADDQTSGTLLLKVNFSANETFIGTITIYNNNDYIFSEEVSFSNENLTFEYSKTLSNITCSAENMFYVKIVAPNNTTIVMTNSYAKLTANNAEVINQISPFNVEYFNGKYYISDCSSGTAKIAEIAVSDMKNMYCLDWIDTGIQCLQYKTAFQTNVGIIGDRIDYYLGVDGKVHLIDRTTNTSQVLPDYYSMPDWFQFTNEKSSFLTHDSLYYYNYETQLTNNTLSYSNTYLRYSVNYYNAISFATAKYLSEYFNSACSLKFAVVSSNSAEISGAAMHKTSVNPVNLGKGINMHCYYEEISSSKIVVCCFAKYYNKIIKYRFRYSTVIGNMTLLSPISIGDYDEYFEGANNDYFVVKNGILKYYKK